MVCLCFLDFADLVVCLSFCGSSGLLVRLVGFVWVCCLCLGLVCWFSLVTCLSW